MTTVLMTGGHSGLGLVGAKTLAKRYGCNLILAGRDPERVAQGAQQVRAESGVSVETLTMDLNSLDSVREGAVRCRAMLQAVAATGQKLQGMVFNAGAQFQGAVTYSADGYEETFAGNCLGHFLLVHLLLDSVAANGRIVWTASGTHDPALLDGKSVGKAVEPDARALARQGRDGKAISGGRRYATSKLCAIMYAYELDRRLRWAGTPVVSIAYDPGFLPDTGMGLQAPAIFRTSAVKFLLRKLGMTMGQMPLSGEALAMLAADPAYAHSSGRYFHSKNGILGETRSSVKSYDQPAAVTLWSDSEQLVRLSEGERPVALRSPKL
jgi:NAD(P)-dependent dehydrogenase (short-subunit alcohol dehydrogenase family)